MVIAMRGRVFQRPHQKNKHEWTVVVYLPGYRQKWLTVKGHKPTAEKKLTALLAELDGGASLDPSQTTLGDYLKLWLSEMKPRVRFETHRRYSEICQLHISKALGNKPIGALKQDDVRGYFTGLSARGVNPNTIRQHHAVLHHALADAVTRGLTNRNVTVGVSAPPRYQKDMQVWTTGEINRFLEANRDLPLYPLFFTALFTGMRRSELLGLQWGDIDWLGSQLSVKRGWQHRGAVRLFMPPKTRRGARSIALSPSTVAVLRDLYAGQGRDQGVFWRAGSCPSPNAITKAWQRACDRAGVPVIRLHDARHTHATILLQQGIHPKIVQERLGHASISMTLDTYSHVVPGMQERAAAGFDVIVGKRVFVADS